LSPGRLSSIFVKLGGANDRPQRLGPKDHIANGGNGEAGAERDIGQHARLRLCQLFAIGRQIGQHRRGKHALVLDEVPVDEDRNDQKDGDDTPP